MDDLEYIEGELSHEEEFVGNYSIKAKWSMGGESSRLMEVSRFFNTPDDLDEAGIFKEGRQLIAYSPLGFVELENLGFDPSEIEKKYDE